MSAQVDQGLVERIVEGVLRALGDDKPARRDDLPPYISDADAREQFYGGCSPAHYYGVLVKAPGFPEAVPIGGRLKVRRTADHLRFLAERKASPLPPEPEPAPVRRRRRRGLT